MIFDEPIKVNKKSDNEFTISIATSDSTLIVKTLSKKSLEQLYIDLEEVLEEK